MAAFQKLSYHALIMAGGKGERFWPWSRQKRPKQLLPLFGKKTLIEMTVERLLPLIPKDRIWIVTNQEQAQAMAKRMPFFSKSNLIIEPVGRDSAGAVMLGCATVAAKDPRAVTALLPADHLIANSRSYLRILRQSFEIASANSVLLTIGVKPKEASSAYGYIERGPKMKNQTRTYHVRRFLEKPDIHTAQRLIKSKRFYWNAGMFVWSTRAIREAFEEYSPIHAAGWQALIRNRKKYLTTSFLGLPKISIDYAVMEKAKNICVMEGAFDWDDIGSWTALYQHIPQDRLGNCNRGSFVSIDSHRCIVLAREKVVATLGVQDLIIVQTDDATLICHRNAAQRVKEIVKQLPPKLR